MDKTQEIAKLDRTIDDHNRILYLIICYIYFDPHNETPVPF